MRMGNIFEDVLLTVDILMHYVAEINMREGLCNSKYYGLFLRKGVNVGKFGKQFNEVSQTFPQHQVRFVVETMVRLYELGPSVTLFRTVMRQIYPRSIIYLAAVESRELLIYIGR